MQQNTLKWCLYPYAESPILIKNVEWTENPEQADIIVDFEMEAERENIEENNKWIIPGQGPNGTTRVYVYVTIGKKKSIKTDDTSAFIHFNFENFKKMDSTLQDKIIARYKKINRHLLSLSQDLSSSGSRMSLEVSSSSPLTTSFITPPPSPSSPRLSSSTEEKIPPSSSPRPLTTVEATVSPPPPASSPRPSTTAEAIIPPSSSPRPLESSPSVEIKVLKESDCKTESQKPTTKSNSIMSSRIWCSKWMFALYFFVLCLIAAGIVVAIFYKKGAFNH